MKYKFEIGVTLAAFLFVAFVFAPFVGAAGTEYSEVDVIVYNYTYYTTYIVYDDGRIKELESNNTVLHLQNLRLNSDGMKIYYQLKGLRKTFERWQDFTVFRHNPTNSGEGYDYALCGEKYEGSKNDCGVVYCTGSMMPYFNCEEKLLFVRDRNIQVNDIIDFSLPQPKYAVDEDGKEVIVTHFIHIVRAIDGDTITTGGLNVGNSIYYENYTGFDDEQIDISMVRGKLKGVIW